MVYRYERNSGKGDATESVKGLMDYLFDIVGVHRIQTNLDFGNIVSKHLSEWVGMRLEVHFIEDYWNNVDWTDSFTLGILKGLR